MKHGAGPPSASPHTALAAPAVPATGRGVRGASSTAPLAALVEIASGTAERRWPDDSTDYWLLAGCVVVLLLVAGILAFVVLKKRAKGTVGTSDTTCVLHPHFRVPAGRLGDFKAGFQGFYSSVKPDDEGILYYGFTVDEANNKVFCREAYKDSSGLLAHLEHVDANLKAALDIGTLESLEVHGPASELVKLRPALEPLGCEFYTSDAGSKLYKACLPTSWDSGVTDTSCLLRPHFHAPEGKLAELSATFEEFYQSVQPEEEGLLFYGFAVNEEARKVLCHEAYGDAQGILAHLQHVDSAFQKARSIADLIGLEVHGPATELDKLRDTLAPLNCKFFVTASGSRTWIQGPAGDAKGDELAGDADIGELLKKSADRMTQQLQTKVEKGSRLRDIVEGRASSFTEKAKDFIINELNNTASALLRAIDADEAAMLVDFNRAVEASFPPISVLLAGIASPAILSMSLVAHVLQLFALFLPVLIGTAWSLYQDWGATCDIPTITAWIWAAFALSLVLTLGHGSLALQIHLGKAALKAKAAEITARLEANAADGEAGISDMQEIFIGSAVLVQEALLLEDGIRRSFWGNAIGAGTFLWLFAALWNCVIVIGWTFVPGTIAFHEKAHAVAAGDFCGAWASVFTARVVCLLTPLFFFMNVAQVVHWVLVTVIHSNAVASALLNGAKQFDDGNAGFPVVQILVKAFVLRASTDTVPAKLTIALGEALRLSREREELEQKLEEVKNRIRASQQERKSLRETAKVSGETMEANMAILEKAGEQDAAQWKQKGIDLVREAEHRAALGQQVATQELDRIVQYVMELADQVQNHEMVKSAIAKAKKAADEAHATAASGLAQAQSAAETGMQHAQTGFEKGMAYAQSADAQSALAQAREAAAQASASGAAQAAAQAKEAAAKLAGQMSPK